MTSLRMAFLFSAGAALSAWPAVAQETAPLGPEPALEALVAEALAQNPDVRALGEALDSARARPEQAQALPDPMVSVLYVNDGWSPSLGEMPMTTLGFMGSQTLPWPGKRARREELAARDAVPASERLERQRLTVAAGVRRAFWGLVLAEESLGVLREQAEVWKEAEGVARARYAVGQGAQQDVLRAQVEITRFEQLRAEQEADGRDPPGRALPPRRARGDARRRRAAPGSPCAPSPATSPPCRRRPRRRFPSCAPAPPASSAGSSRSSWRSATSSPTSPSRPGT